MPLRKVGSTAAALVQTQESDDLFRGNLLGPGFILDDVTNDVSSDAHLSATIVPYLHSESDYQHKSYTIEETITIAAHEEDKFNKCRYTDESFTGAPMVEIEAGIYGLQIINKTYLQALHELRLAAFGSVYYDICGEIELPAEN